MIDLVQNNLKKIQTICQNNNVAELYLFGSAVSKSFSKTSDLDFAVLFSSSISPLQKGDSFFALKDALEDLFAKDIDLISYGVVKNPIFKEELDKTKVELYAA